METRFWQYEPRDVPGQGQFESWAGRRGFRRLARESLRRRGMDPDLIMSLGSDVSLSPGGVDRMVRGSGGRVSRGQDRLTVARDATAMTRRELGARAQSVGASVDQFSVATAYERRVAASLVGADYRQRQELLEDYSPEQIKVLYKVSARYRDLMAQGQAQAKADARDDGLIYTPFQNGPNYVTAEEWAGRELEEEMGGEIEFVWGGEKRGPVESALRFPGEQILGGLGKFMAWFEKQDPMIAGPLARTKEGQFPHYDPTGTTAFDRGSELSRPVAAVMLTGIAAPFALGEIGLEETTGVHSRTVSGAIQGQVAEDILTEVINPAALVLVAPLVLQGVRPGMSAAAVSAKMTSNLLGTGMEPELVRGTLQGLTLLSRKGMGALRTIPQNVRGTRAFQAVLHGEAGGGRLSIGAESGVLREAEEVFVASKGAVADALRETSAMRAAAKAEPLLQGNLDEALKALGTRRKEYINARKELNKARITSERDEVVASVRRSGGDDSIADLVGDAFERSAANEVAEEVLLNASWWRQSIASVGAAITGTPPGVTGRLATRRDILLHALRRYTYEAVHPLFKDVQQSLKVELPHITFTGPTKWAKEAEGTYKAYHVIQHPEWFDGLSVTLKKRVDQAQTAMRARLEAAKAMGYPIEALDDMYLEQLWEIPASRLTVGDVPLPGRVSVAKPRLYDDYLKGLNQGLVPKELSVEELMQHSAGLLDQAVSEAWMRQEVLRRFGTKGTPSVSKGTAPFRHFLYRGWNGDKDIVNWVSKIDSPVGSNIRGLSNLSAAFRGTVFGLADIAVSGVQFPLSIAHGGFQVGIGTLNRSLELLNLPYFHVYAKDATFISRLVSGAKDGLHVGIGPSAVSLRGGTLLKYAPKVGKALDKPLSRVIDIAAQAQFGHALTAVRLRMYEGNLMVLRMVGRNIDDPAVRRMAAEWANSATGASRGPMVKGRRVIESIALTSVQMTRANLSVYGQLISQLSPAAGRMERLRAAMTLANLGAYTYGLQYLFNSVFGDGPMEWRPGTSQWGTIRIGGTTVPILPQRSILRAIDKSVEILERYRTDEEDADLWDLAKVWSQVAVGKGSPLAGIPLAIAGVGFEPETSQFHVGGLSAKGRLVGVLPIPPIGEQIAFQERDALAITVAGLGFNPYDTPAGRLLREEFERTTGAELNWESPAHMSKVEGSSKLDKLWKRSREESREYGSKTAITSFEIQEEIGQAEEDKGIVLLAEAIRSGDAQAAQQWSDARGGFLAFRDGKWDARFTPREATTEIGRLVDEYYGLNPKGLEFTDSSGVTDWGAFQKARDAVLTRMPKDDADAIRDKEKFIDPAAEAVDRQFRAAQDVLRPYWDLKSEVWRNLRSRNPDFQQYPNMEDFLKAKARELLETGVTEKDLPWRLGRLPIVSRISELIQTMRFQYRRVHPEVDDALVKWYGSTPIRQQGRGGRRGVRGR